MRTQQEWEAREAQLVQQADDLRVEVKGLRAQVALLESGKAIQAERKKVATKEAERVSFRDQMNQEKAALHAEVDRLTAESTELRRQLNLLESAPAARSRATKAKSKGKQKS